MSLPRIGVVIVTMGTRPRELDALLASVEKQDVPTRGVLVGNATPLTEVDADVIKIPLEENLGCPGGRNVGLAMLCESGEVDVVGELDDDGLLMTAFLGGGHAFSVPMLNEIGLWPAEFFFGHEESDLAWRSLDAGWEILYEPELVLQHPKASPARHAVYYRFTARNRVWLARLRERGL
ncbi:GT2 family glycosyltransferase [Kitasatospora sp. GP82]|nr:GT2 family glycosyltransferase [Kitasatospora sp. GP82]